MKPEEMVVMMIRGAIVGLPMSTEGCSLLRRNRSEDAVRRTWEREKDHELGTH